MATAETSKPRPTVKGSPPIPDDLIEALTISDPVWIRTLKAERASAGLDRRDEMWEGVYVMSPAADLEHQRFAQELWLVFHQVLPLAGGGIAYNVVNVSDRVQGWITNFREPDVAVYLADNLAIACGTHMVGGPDLAVEILSESDLARKKLDFYAKVNTRELLLLDRDPWALELYRLIDGQLRLVGIATATNGEILSSDVLPLTFRLLPGPDRPTLEVAHRDGGTTWRI